MSKRTREPQTIAAADVGQMPDFLQTEQTATDTLEPPQGQLAPEPIDQQAAAVDWAQSILGGWIDEQFGIDADVQFAVWRTGAPEISLDGSFAPDQLEALAIWMRAHPKPAPVAEPAPVED